MIKITIICVGKIKEKFFCAAAEEYLKRLSRYCKFSITELADEKTPDGASKAACQKIKEVEGKRILESIRDGMYVIVLDLKGTQLSSEEFAAKLDKLMVDGISSIAFVIGGSLGLHKSVTERADYLFSFSKLTFPHQLMRIILLEQIYRSFKILSNEPYHK